MQVVSSLPGKCASYSYKLARRAIIYDFTSVFGIGAECQLGAEYERGTAVQ